MLCCKDWVDAHCSSPNKYVPRYPVNLGTSFQVDVEKCLGLSDRIINRLQF